MFTCIEECIENMVFGTWNNIIYTEFKVGIQIKRSLTLSGIMLTFAVLLM